MLNLTWEVFFHTGNIETYLLCKQLENENEATPDIDTNQSKDFELPVI